MQKQQRADARPPK